MMGYYKPVDPRDIWEYATRKLTDVSNIWQYATRTLTSASNVAGDIWSYETRTISDFLVVSDNVQKSDVTEYQCDGGTNINGHSINVKKYKMLKKGSIRIKFDAKGHGNVYIYKNGENIANIAFDDSNYQEYAEDINDLSEFDTITIKLHSAQYETSYIKNIRLCYDITDDEVIELE